MNFQLTRVNFCSPPSLLVSSRNVFSQRCNLATVSRYHPESSLSRASKLLAPLIKDNYDIDELTVSTMSNVVRHQLHWTPGCQNSNSITCCTDASATVMLSIPTLHILRQTWSILLATQFCLNISKFTKQAEGMGGTNDYDDDDLFYPQHWDRHCNKNI